MANDSNGPNMENLTVPAGAEYLVSALLRLFEHTLRASKDYDAMMEAKAALIRAGVKLPLGW